MGSDLKTGFFGGSFDPIHFGHLNLMIELKEQCDLDHVLVCPAHTSPMKAKTVPLASGEHRLEMVQIAVSDIAWAEVTRVEVDRPPPSYTVDTVQLILNKRHVGALYLMIDEDMAYTMSFWKEAEKILEMACPLVGTRCGFDLERLKKLPVALRSKLEAGEVKISTMDVRSTQVRERIGRNQFCGHLVPLKVLDYIYQNGLY